MSKVLGYRRPYFDTQPAHLYPGYRSTIKRAPSKPLVPLPHTLSEVTGPLFGPADLGPNDHDLTAQHEDAPIGERIVVSGRVLDENSKPVANALIELWQANAAGRYRHDIDDHDAPLDPNFTGVGRVLTGADGAYRFLTIKPGAYPWRNHYNAWRPAHLHFSLFGLGLVQRLVTQMYFPHDPLLPYDPMYNSIPNEKARERLISQFDWERTIPDTALAYRFDIVLRGREDTPMETTRS
ncbi:MAG TPA: protocatechuate 3,4-dioxygenase subunit beta [Casimicrobiaceae bacterium]|jgi:protocatechuate 3,4-dioxygenase beta subunit|nr:protocatechuate 3,4-dioxygenase subunit beta [Casimicrobiaceae bacterium]